MALRYGKVGGITQLLDRIAALGQHKPYNALLVLLQRPAATYVLPAQAWEERFGRVIRPNEQPLVLLQPMGPVMFLFDVSQTEQGPNARPLPLHLENPYRMRDAPDAARAVNWVIDNAKFDGVRVSDARFGLPFAGCIHRTDASVLQVVPLGRSRENHGAAVQYEVLLNDAHSPTERLATLAHELGHLYCGHLGPCRSELWPEETFWRDRHGLPEAQRELEAESVARVVFRRLYPDLALPDHLSQYFAVEPEFTDADLL